MRIAATSTFILVVGFSLLPCPEARAERATPQEMETICQRWLAYTVDQQGSWAGAADPKIVGVQEIMAGDLVVGRCYSIAPRGCVVVPVLKEMPPVKAYSGEHDLDVSQTVGFPQLLREVLALRMAAYIERYGSVEASQPERGEVLFDREHRQLWDRLTVAPEQFQADLASGGFGTRAEVGPLLTTNWHQGGPYNLDCPLGDGGRTVVGCVATAAAQVMRYHNWPPNGIGDHSYTWDGDQSCGGDVGGGELYADFSDSYDWANMPNNCSGGCTTAEQDALSELCYEVGVAFNMDYGRCGSGAYTGAAAAVMPTYFDYASGIQEKDRSDYTAQTWFNMIALEINEGRPMLYTLIMPGAGHAIVCDGWRDSPQNEYHMNYGWGGSYNGWYAIDNLYGTVDPMYESLVKGIEPADSTAPEPDPMYFETLPHATTDGIEMEATEATDADSPPCQYQFTCEVGGSGCTDTGWMSGRVYEDTGLDPNKEFTYRVRARDAADPPNVTADSAPASAYSPANLPGAPVLGNETGSSMDITINPNGNPSYTEYVIYCYYTTDPFWEYVYVDASGYQSVDPVWQSEVDWGTITVRNMQPETEYCFILGARNVELVETYGGPPACSYTTAQEALILSVASCHDHGAAGELFLDVTEGDPGDNIEPRMGGIEKLEFLMDSNVSSVSASVSCDINTHGGVATPTADGSDTVVVTFSPSLPDQDCCQVTLGGDANDNAFVAILAGDADRDGSVTTADGSGITQRLGHAVDEGNCQYDVDLDSSITTADGSFSTQRLGHVTPSCP